MEGVSSEFLIYDFPDSDFSCRGILPWTTTVPNYATQDHVRLPLHDNAYSCSNAAMKDEIFGDVIFLGNGLLKLFLPTACLDIAYNRRHSGNTMPCGKGNGDNSIMEFIGKKDLPLHLRPKFKKPPSPRESFAGWLRGYN